MMEILISNMTLKLNILVINFLFQNKKKYINIKLNHIISGKYIKFRKEK